MNQAALITGANGGIGEALCRIFADAGYLIIPTDCSDEKKLENSIVPLDLAAFVADAGVRQTFINHVRERLDGTHLKVLINNAALQVLGGTDTITQKEFASTLDVNLFAPFLLTQCFLTDLEKAQGSVINIGSIHSYLTKPGFVAYATSKSALLGLSRALAVDLGGRIRVNTIQPAATETAMLKAGFEENPQDYETLQTYHPARRIASPIEVAQLALFLASDQANFITGAAMNIDGGIGVRLHDPE